VSRDLDGLPPGFGSAFETDSARRTFSFYDVDKMHGLPVGVQIVGEHLEEERVLACMKLVRDVIETLDLGDRK
jgi:hypothetical protein